MSTIINADTSDGLKFTSDTSGEIKLQSAGADIATVSSSGITLATGKDLTLSSTALDASASGIYLGGTVAANLLDDYEEGTFTPVIEGNSVTGTGTYNFQVGTYIKIGNMVHIQWNAQSTAHTGSGAIKLAGLPFAAASTTNNFAAFAVYNAEITYAANSYPMPFVAPGNSFIWVNQNTVGGGSPSSATDLVGQYIISGTYYCA